MKPAEEDRNATQWNALRDLWQAEPPGALATLYQLAPHPAIGLCAFYPLSKLAQGIGRSYGMAPWFLPFGVAADGDGQFGFYARAEVSPEHWPVLFAEEQESFLRPVASNASAFLHWCVLMNRYEAEALGMDTDWDDANLLPLSVLEKALDLPVELVSGTLPHNDTELYHRLAALDPDDAVSRCHLGCAHLLRHENEAALSLFAEARRATPWFADPAFLIADVYRDSEDYARAIPFYWEVATTLLSLCTRTWEWNLGEDYPEADIYEVAADCLAQYQRFAPPALTGNPLWPAITREDPYDPSRRLKLARTLQTQNDLCGAEREFLNALALSAGDTSAFPDRCYDALDALYTAQSRERDLHLLRLDRSLPRP